MIQSSFFSCKPASCWSFAMLIPSLRYRFSGEKKSSRLDVLGEESCLYLKLRHLGFLFIFFFTCCAFVRLHSCPDSVYFMASSVQFISFLSHVNKGWFVSQAVIAEGRETGSVLVAVQTNRLRRDYSGYSGRENIQFQNAFICPVSSVFKPLLINTEKLSIPWATLATSCRFAKVIPYINKGMWESQMLNEDHWEVQKMRPRKSGSLRCQASYF